MGKESPIATPASNETYESKGLDRFTGVMLWPRGGSFSGISGRQKRKSLPREEVRQAFRKSEQQPGGGVLLSYFRPFGRRGPELRSGREEVPRFDEIKIPNGAAIASAYIASQPCRCCIATKADCRCPFHLSESCSPRTVAVANLARDCIKEACRSGGACMITMRLLCRASISIRQKSCISPGSAFPATRAI